MNLERYDLKSSENLLDYEFYSEGPNGKIKKVIRFTLVKMSHLSYYNLGFGDWNEEGKSINDFVISNNHDAERVLATVAAAVLSFTNHYRDVLVFAQGSTSSRTRLYQMGINKYWPEIEPLFVVYGLIEGIGFEPFQNNKNYHAFIVTRKKT